MTPFSGQQDREIILLELLPQFAHCVHAGLSGIGGQRCRGCIFEIGPDLLLPLDPCLTQEICELTGWSFPKAGGSVGQISVTSSHSGTFPRFTLLTFELKGRIVWLGGVPNDRIPQFRQPT
jgi:hypothetical protein